jgi:hypothetical protein
MTFLFWARTRGHKQWENISGLVLIVSAIPIFTIALLNYFSGREWWTYILPIPMVLFLIIELFFDYIYGLNFRKSKLLIVYLFFYYTGLAGLIGYTFLVNRIMGYILLAVYFIHQIMAVYAHRKNK